MTKAGGGAARKGGAVVSVYEDGPLIVRGDFVITAQDGRPIPAGRGTVALCRCGRSAIKPFCDGSHTRTGFRAPGDAQGQRAAD
jgi:CDGSH-type Zn-finger protein